MLKELCDLLHSGAIIAIPTETTYGLAGSFNHPEAWKTLYEIKKRDIGRPLPVLISSLKDLDSLVEPPPEQFKRLAHQFLPGPLTVVLKKKTGLERPFLDENSIAIRYSSHLVTSQIVRAFGQPLFLTSANISGNGVPAGPEEVRSNFDNRVYVVVEDEELTMPSESTIVSLVGGVPQILRQGPITEDEIARVLG